MISPVEEIKARLDILDVVREYVPELKRSGANWKARCPFHAEKSPSFMVHPGKQIFHCFGCSLGGDMFEFVQKIEGIEFPDALRILAAKANVILERVDPALTSARTRMLDLLDTAASFFAQSLDSPAGVTCRQYLFEQRHMAPEVAKDWQLGYAPASWDSLSQYLSSKRYSEQEIVAAGLALARDPARGRGIYDRFRNRLIFPIRNSSGQVVGFSARVLPGATDEEPKYVNTPQTLVYDKGKILFGYDRARDAIRKAGFVVVVEGQFDLVSSHAAGITHTVAVSGTALTEDHLRLLRRMTDTIALSFDMDLAGVAAATRSIDLALAEGFTVKIIELPEGLKDPDECIRRDPALWTQAVTSALPFVEVAFTRATRGKNLADVESSRSAIATLMPIIRKLVSRVDQSLWIHRLADATSMNEAVLVDELVRGNRGVTSRPQAQSPVRDGDDTNDLAERYLGLLNLTRNPLPWVKQLTGEAFPPGEHRDLANAFALCYSTHIPTSLEEVIKTIEGQSPELAAFAQLINLRVQDVYATLTPDGIEEELAHLARHLERRMLHRQLRQLEQNLREAERLVHHEKVAAVSAEFARLTERLHTL